MKSGEISCFFMQRHAKHEWLKTLCHTGLWHVMKSGEMLQAIPTRQINPFAKLYCLANAVF